MGEDGHVAGTVRVGYTGVPALAWRQRALQTDQSEVEQEMEKQMQDTLPSGMTVKLNGVVNLSDPSKQLIANFSVDGTLATATSKRLFVPVEIFEANAKPVFSQPKRTAPIYFHYAHHDEDQVSITFPPSLSIESTPGAERFMMQKMIILTEGASVKGNTLTLLRDFQIGAVIFKPEEYDDLHSFYAKVIHKDQEQAVLKTAG
jgi:hypothetical protein